jgi:cytochrome P450
VSNQTIDQPQDLVNAAMRTPAGLLDPYQFLAPLVAQGEWHTDGDGHTYVYGYKQCQTMLRSPELLKGGIHTSSVPLHLTDEQRAIIRAGSPPDPGMLSSIDDPDHGRLRRLVSLSFTPKAVDQYHDVAAKALDEALDAVDHHAPIDIAQTICLGIPVQVIGELIGVPLPDRAEFGRISPIAAAGRDPASDFETHMRALDARREQFAYIARMIEQERPNPQDTPLGRLIRLQQEGEKISGEELVSLVSLMYSAGFGTTVRMLTNGLVLLMRHPEQAAALREHPEWARQATDEILRFDNSVSDVRYVAGDNAEIDGHRIEPGSNVTMILAAANFDPRIFESPTTFDITTKRSSLPLSFGFGLHYCLGVALSKLEGDVVFAEMVRRFPNMRLAEEPQRKASYRNREFNAAMVILEP